VGRELVWSGVLGLAFLWMILGLGVFGVTWREESDVSYHAYDV
jgi:hypothetical protein